MDFFSPEYFQALLSPAAQASLTEKLLVVGVIWATMGRKVGKRFGEFKNEMSASLDAHINMFKSHLTAIENKFDDGISEMRAMKEAVSKDLQVNSQRLTAVEGGLKEVKTRVERLEKP